VYLLGRNPLGRRASLGVFVVTVLTAAAYPLIGSANVQSVVYDGFAVAATLACSVRAWRSKAQSRTAWALVAIALTCWSAGDIATDVFRLDDGSVAFPSAADVLYLAGYPALVAAFCLMGRRELRSSLHVGLLDSAIVSVVAAMAAWLVLVDHAKDGPNLWARLTVIAYPAADVLVLVAAIRLLAAKWRPTPAVALLGAAVVVQLTADGGYTLQAAHYSAGGALDIGWLLAYACFLTAAVAPGAARVADATALVQHDRLRFLLLAAALAVAPAVLLLKPAGRNDAVVAGVGAVALWALAMLAARSSFEHVARLGSALVDEHAQLVESEQQLRLMFDCSSLAIVITDADRELLAVNSQVTSLSGYTEAEFRALGIAGVTHPDDRNVDSGLFREMVEGKTNSFKSLKRFVHKDGHLIWGRVSYSVARSDDGRLRLTIGMVEDVTLQHQAEAERDAAFEATELSEQRFRGAFEGGGVGMAITTPAAEFVQVNPAFCAITGYSEAELVGRSVVEITHPDDVERSLARRVASVDAAVTDEAPTSWRKRYVRKDGSIAWVELTVAAVCDDEGRPLYHVTHARDMTAERDLAEARDRAERELRESQERSWTLLSKMLELLMIVGADGAYSWVNKATEFCLGYRSDELIGLQSDALVHPDDLQMIAAVQAHKKAGGEMDAELVTCRMRHKDGTWRTIESRGINLLDDPLIQGVLVSARDVTARAEMERDREKLDFERRVAQRLEAVGQLAAGVAHEINTPIQFVGDSVRFLEESFTELSQLRADFRALLVERGFSSQVDVAEGETDIEYFAERVPAAFVRIADGVERVTSIVQAMQRFAHAPQVDRAPADLAAALQATATVSRNEYKYVADLDLDLNPVPPLLCNVGDLNQVFLNLIVNAAHAIGDRVPAEGERGTIAVRLYVESDGSHVVVSVSDDGVGVPAEAQERIFEPFYTTKDVGRGTGQGLAIARSIVEQHGGTLTFVNRPEGGAMFTVRLPFLQAMEAAA
jgi:PAS domain S-box-containing protein